MNTNMVLVPSLSPKNADDTNAYWKCWDWNNSFASGMAFLGLEYSGENEYITQEFDEQLTVFQVCNDIFH